MNEKPVNKLSDKEKEILEFWEKEDVFAKVLLKNKKGKPYVFYEGPPTANGKPGIHHLEARAFKDAIPRYKTMRGFYVRRKGGWDTHGLPVELQVEKELGLKSKKEIENYGVEAFNEKCKESVWKYVKEWEEFTKRIGYWVDLNDPYITYRTRYIESLWNILKSASDKDLLYKDYKVVPWCPRCGTGLSSHELAQGYENVKDLSVYVKFPVVGKKDTYFLAWTTTPWTLPGNVALAVGKDIEYSEISIEGEEGVYILATERLSILKDRKYEVKNRYRGDSLVGYSYEPLYDFLLKNISGQEKDKLKNAFKVYAADFVTTADGTGIVHTAVMYGQDDFDLGTKVGLPKYHLVNDDGTFKKETGEFSSKFVKEEATDVLIIKDLAARGKLFAKEKYEHSYPFCWRCKTPLIYFARDSWYIKMSSLRDELVKENEKINWEPEHIKKGRFGEWLSEIKDWAISRERYWGTPLPIWKCDSCDQIKVIGSVLELAGKSMGNKFVFVRHGESENNVLSTLNADLAQTYHLTDLGRKQAIKTAKTLKKKGADIIFSSPFTRTMETAQIIAKELGKSPNDILVDERIGEMKFGVFESKKVSEYISFFKNRLQHFSSSPEGGESYGDVRKRVGAFLQEIESKFEGKRIVIVSHEAPIFMMVACAMGLDSREAVEFRGQKDDFVSNAEPYECVWKEGPRNKFYEIDLHKPYIDSVSFACSCGGRMARVKEVMDVWFDSGAMPFAQDHYPFENKKEIDKGFAYPADFISEAIDQTRGWFYTLHAVGAILGKGRAYNNVICLGHILDAEGKKMSKSVGNVVDPILMTEKYGADPLRFWMYSVNAPGDSKNFDERTVDEVVKKVFNLVSNVLSFYELYGGDKKIVGDSKSKNVLDQWILARLEETNRFCSEEMDKYKLLEPARSIRDFISDLSQWYLRRSRERIKEGGPESIEALNTLKFVLIELAKIMAPFTPFYSEMLYKSLKGTMLSVHMESWTDAKKLKVKDANKLIMEMGEVRKVVSLALEQRAKANIKVRQPLGILKIKTKISPSLLEIIKDEVNVKNVEIVPHLDAEVALDISITPLLKKEGDFRELARNVQEFRKNLGLNPHEKIFLLVSDKIANIDIVNEFEKELLKQASLSGIQVISGQQNLFEIKK